MVGRCGECQKSIHGNAYSLKCVKCSNSFHKHCTGLDSGELDKIFADTQAANNWNCGKCPITYEGMGGRNPTATPTIEALFEAFKELRDDLSRVKAKNTQLERRIAQLENENETIKKENAEQAKSLDFLSGEFDKHRNNPPRGTKSPEAETIQLANDLEEVKAYLRRNNLEISGIPEAASEDLHYTAIKIAKQMGVDITPTDIDVVHRIPTRAKGMPKPILVKFVRRDIRDAILQGKVGMARLRTGMLGFAQDNPIYISEHLTPKMQALAKRARRLKPKGCEFVWIKNGCLYVRKTKTSSAIKINDSKTMEELEKEYGV